MTKKKKKGKSSPARRSVSLSVDWGDEDSVKAAMAIALDATGDYDELEIEEDSGLSSFREGTFYLVKLGSKEYQVAQDEDSAFKLAVAVVAQDLEESPENFEQNFIESHIDTDRLKKDLWPDVEESNRDRLQDEANRHPTRFLEDHEGTIDSSWLDLLRDEDGNWKDDIEVPDKAIEKVIEHETEQQLDDPMEYLREIYGDEAGAKAIQIAGIDVAAAADEAVSVDGVGHFLSHYDGHMHDGPGGIVYWRTN